MSKIVISLITVLMCVPAFAEVDKCLNAAADAVIQFLQKENPGSDMWKSVKGDDLQYLFDANKTVGNFTLVDVVEEEFEQTAIFSEDGTDYVVFVGYSNDDEGHCKIGEVDSGQNDQD